MADLVARLRQAGWRVLVVTASPAEAVLRGAQELGIPEGDVLAVRLEFRDGIATGRPSEIMPLTWSEGKADALDAYGVSDRLTLAVGNSMDDVPMLRRAEAGMLCIPRPGAADDPWMGEAEGSERIVRVASDEGFWLHEATEGPKDYRELAWHYSQTQSADA